MKKILFIMPFMAISLHASCNKSNPNKVSEQEMIDAFTMKGVDYLQFKIEENANCSLFFFAPSSFHTIHENSIIGMYSEYFVVKNGETYHKYTRSNKEADFVEDDYKEGDFHTIDELVEQELEVLKECKYEDFKYQENSKEYLIDYMEFDELEHSAIKFVNKKLVYFDSWFDEEKRENGYHHELSYDKIEPPSPTI